MICNWLTIAVLAGFSAGITIFAGCNNSPTENPNNTSNKMPSEQKTVSAPTQISPSQNPVSKKDEEVHGHKTGSHGGIITSLGRDSYHVEAVFEKGGVLRLFLLGNDETKVQEIDSQELKGYAKLPNGNESAIFVIKPQPQPDDAAGKTSQFIGQIPAELIGQNLNVTVPSIRIAGERFRLGFTSAPEAHGDDVMPDKVSDAAEQALYLTPGGVYTEEDIKANGNVTASHKFKGFMASHDLHPKVGDKICPVTLTKANPKCTWIVGGKKYEFCCPPCVDEFVKQAKESTKGIKQPEDFIKTDSADAP